jgi:hypothetical protein
MPRATPARRSGNGAYQLVGEFAADRGADLGDLLDRRQPVETRGQRILQCRRNGERRQRPVDAPALRSGDEQAALEHRLGQFLDKERHAVGLGDDLRRHLGG